MVPASRKALVIAAPGAPTSNGIASWNMFHPRLATVLMSPFGRSSVSTPNVSTTTSERVVTRLPVGRSRPTTYQSLPYPVTVSIISSCVRSVPPGCSAPRSSRASSISQNLGAGMPRSVTGAGSDELTTTAPASDSAAVVPTFTSPRRSKLYHSSAPPPYWLASSVHSSNWSGLVRVENVTAYSMRSRCQACSPAAGWLNSSSTHATHAAHAARTSAASPAAIGVPTFGRALRTQTGQRGPQPSSVEGATGDEAVVGEGGGVESDGIGGGEWRHGEGGAERRSVVLGGGLGGEQTQEVAAGIDAEAQSGDAGRGVEPARLALDDHLERHARGVEVRCLEPGVGRDRAEDASRRADGVAAPAGDDRCAPVLGLELPHLPLAGEQPQRVGGAGGEAGRDVVAGRRRLDAGPAGDRRHPCSLRPGARRAARSDRWTRRRRRR